MRVIAGSARSLKLVTPVGNDTRPTTDRIKETLFNMIQDRLPGSMVLDLFAGSGALGIEALSRGAKQAYFVENNSAAYDCIRKNINFTKMENRATLLRQDVLSALNTLRERRFDVVFIDPPYQMGYEEKVLRLLAQADYVHEKTLIILETGIQSAQEDFLPAKLEVVKEKIYKTNKHLFVKKITNTRLETTPEQKQ